MYLRGQNLPLKKRGAIIGRIKVLKAEIFQVIHLIHISYIKDLINK